MSCLSWTLGLVLFCFARGAAVPKASPSVSPASVSAQPKPGGSEITPSVAVTLFSEATPVLIRKVAATSRGTAPVTVTTSGTEEQIVQRKASNRSNTFLTLVTRVGTWWSELFGVTRKASKKKDKSKKKTAAKKKSPGSKKSGAGKKKGGSSTKKGATSAKKKGGVSGNKKSGSAGEKKGGSAAKKKASSGKKKGGSSGKKKGGASGKKKGGSTGKKKEGSSDKKKPPKVEKGTGPLTKNMTGLRGHKKRPSQDESGDKIQKNEDKGSGNEKSTSYGAEGTRSGNGQKDKEEYCRCKEALGPTMECFSMVREETLQCEPRDCERKYECVTSDITYGTMLCRHRYASIRLVRDYVRDGVTYCRKEPIDNDFFVPFDGLIVDEEQSPKLY